MRQPKPFFRKFTNTWYVTLSGTQINLGADKEEAFQKYHELMAGRGRATISYRSMAHLFDAYLSWLQQNRAEGTYDKSLHYLTLFAQHLGSGFTIASLEPTHVTQWIESKKGWSSSTGNDAVSIVQRAFNWAVKRGNLDRSPIAVIPEKPARTRRETVYSPPQWAELRALVTDQEFGDLLDFMWATGCRPIEARTVCASHVDLQNAMAVFPPSEAKGRKNERVIFLPDEALGICQRLCEQNLTGMLFLNTKGRPWTKDSINCRFQRLKKKLKRPMCAYAIRHSFATEGLKSGVDSLTLAQIMGHSDTTMLAKHYAHLARNPAYLLETARKLRGS
jgi:integrase